MTVKECITCAKYDLRDIHSRGYYCNKHGRHMAIDESCPSWSDSLRSNRTIEDAIDRLRKRGYNGAPDSSYWYITSTVCKITGLGDQNRYMDAFKKLKYYLLSTEEGNRFLENYHISGLFLSQILLDSYEQDKEATKALVEDDLLPQFDMFADEVESGNMSQAFTYYQFIMDYISIKFKEDTVVDVAYDPEEESIVALKPYTRIYCQNLSQI